MHQSTIPETGFLRIRHICGDKKRGIAPLIPICRSAWWLGVKSGKFPKGVLLGPRTRAWRVEDIRALIAAPSTREAA
jgi:prophage regulatory protein